MTAVWQVSDPAAVSGEPGGDPDRPAFATVYAAHYASLVRLAYATTGSVPAAEDVVQEVFAELYRRFDLVAEPTRYLRRAVVSRCVSWIRRRQLERRYANSQPAPSSIAPLGPEGAAVRDALARLRPRQRAAVFLRFYLDLPESEIANLLGCRPGTVKSLLHRAFVVLRGVLDDD